MRKPLAFVFAALAIFAGSDLAFARGDKKPTPEPFYRKYLVKGDPLDDAIAEQEKRVEASPDDAGLRNDFGNLLAERRFAAEAAEQYEIAIKLDPHNFISAYNLGLVRETEGKISAAISAYEKSIKRKPGFPQSRFRLGRLYEQTNRPESAVQEYAAALWIDPGMKDPKRNPLVIDSELVYLASLANYHRDVAVASMADSNVYFDTDRFRKLPTTRAISSKEAEGGEEEAPLAPRDVGSPTTAPGATRAGEPARGGVNAKPAAGQALPPGAARPAPAPGMRRTPLAGRPGPPTAAPAPVTTPVPVPPESAEPAPNNPETPPESVPEPSTTPSPDVEPS
ncbi:MAG TPA: tetratricopeptide repeat protein [Thermoanaerobaculia bacterium]|nr:tetratricopeptide repeat protein [Thermoanaerobaculia bacterium]